MKELKLVLFRTKVRKVKPAHDHGRLLKVQNPKLLFITISLTSILSSWLGEAITRSCGGFSTHESDLWLWCSADAVSGRVSGTQQIVHSMGVAVGSKRINQAGQALLILTGRPGRGMNFNVRDVHLFVIFMCVALRVSWFCSHLNLLKCFCFYTWASTDWNIKRYKWI